MYASGKKKNKLFVKTKDKGNVENQKIGFWSLESSHLWNLESIDVEYGIHRHGIRNPQRGIRNPRLSRFTLHGAMCKFRLLHFESVYFLKS